MRLPWATAFDGLGPSTTVMPGDYEIAEIRRRSDHDGYCRFDLRFEFSNGSEVDEYDVNLCETWAIAVNDRGSVEIATSEREAYKLIDAAYETIFDETQRRW